ncbi:MAG: hypothetical protein PHU14_04345 [Methylovulum sp.]|nr:hypothetical protein [Methylovulum sp.]
MKVIIEIEEQDDMQKIGHFLKSLEVAPIQVDYLKKHQQLQNFFDYLARESVPVPKIDMPDWEMGNAR